MDLDHQRDPRLDSLLDALGDLVEGLLADVLALDAAVVAHAEEDLAVSVLVEHRGNGGARGIDLGRGLLVLDVFGLRAQVHALASGRSQRLVREVSLYRERRGTGVIALDTAGKPAVAYTGLNILFARTIYQMLQGGSYPLFGCKHFFSSFALLLEFLSYPMQVAYHVDRVSQVLVAK